jgi:hypothetical protein
MWVIYQVLRGEQWFVASVQETKTNNIKRTWTRDPEKALKFRTENGTKRFIQTQVRGENIRYQPLEYTITEWMF